MNYKITGYKPEKLFHFFFSPCACRLFDDHIEKCIPVIPQISFFGKCHEIVTDCFLVGRATRNGTDVFEKVK